MHHVNGRQEPTTTLDQSTQTEETTSRPSTSGTSNTPSPRTTSSPSQTSSATITTEEPTTSAGSTTQPSSTFNDGTTTSQETSTSSSATASRTTLSRSETTELAPSTDSATSPVTSQTSQRITSPTGGSTSQSEIISIPSQTTSSIPPTTFSVSTTSSSIVTSFLDTQALSSASLSTNPSTSFATRSIVTTSLLLDSLTSSTPATITPNPTSISNGVQSGTVSGPTSTSGVTSVVVTTVITVDGVASTFATLVPTLAASPEDSTALSARTSKIVGAVVGSTLAILGVLLALFYISRRRRKMQAARNTPRLQAPRQMLDTEDFDLSEPGPAPYQYGIVGARAGPNASGSIFHEALPGTNAHSYSRSIVGENDPLLAHHMRGDSADIDSIATSSPRESTHFRASSTTGLLYDSSDPFASMGSGSSRAHPAAVAKAIEARPRAGDHHVYPPSAYHGHSSQLSGPHAGGVVVHQDAGRVGAPDNIAPPAYRDSKTTR